MNLAKLPQAERDEIEKDRKLWHEAYKLVKYEPRLNVKRWLSQLSDEEYRENMRYRLNKTQQTLKGIR